MTTDPIDPLTRLWGRGRTYATIAGACIALVLLGIVVPLTLGHAPHALTSSVPPLPAYSPGLSPPEPTLAPDVTAVPSGSRRASDTGITPGEITIGVAVASLGGVTGFGGDVSGYDPAQQQQIFHAFVVDLNARGGVDGRRIRDVYTTFNILSATSQTAACKELTETRHAFAVVSVLGIFGDPILCFTNDHHVPYLAIDGAPSDYYTRAGGLLFTVQSSTLRTQVNAAAELVRLGQLSGTGRIGFVHAGGFWTADEQEVARRVERLTGKHIVTAEVSASTAEIATALGQSRSAAASFCAAGVDKVLLGLNVLYASQFVDGWDRTTCKPPAYFLSDHAYQTASNSFLSAMPTSFFGHAVAVTSTVDGGPESGEPTRALDRRCLDISAAHGGGRYDPSDGTAAEVVTACGLIQLVEFGLRGAGLNPTRLAFVAALSALGPVTSPGFAAGSLSQTKHDEADYVRAVQADHACGCWKLTGDGRFRPGLMR